MHTTAPANASKTGFTLVELLFGLTISGIVSAGVFASFLLNQNGWLITTLTIQSSSAASTAIGRMVYGVGGPSLRSEERGEVELLGDLDDEGSWQVIFSDGVRWVGYNAPAGVLTNQDGDILASQVETCTVNVQPQGLHIELTITDTQRGFLSTTSLESFVRFRNQSS